MSMKDLVQDLIRKREGPFWTAFDSGEEVPLDVDFDGNRIFKQDAIAYVHGELARRKKDRSDLEQQWSLNANFLCGNQYSAVLNGEVVQSDYISDYEEREVFNRIAPLIETRIANLKKINYSMTVYPRTSELDDYDKADISTRLLRFIQETTDFNAKKNRLIAWNELCGSAFWVCWWDKNKRPYSADGTPVPGEALGDIDYGLLSPYEVYPDSVFVQGVENQRSIIVEQVRNVEEIYEMYDIQVPGQRVNTFSLTPMTTVTGMGRQNTILGLGSQAVENAAKVITYFERPSMRRPKGRMIIVIGDDKLAYYGELPYDSVPIVQVSCKEVSGQFFGKSTIEDLIPVQRAYNGCVNRIHEYIQRLACGNLVVPAGGVKNMDDICENGLAPGQVLEVEREAPFMPDMLSPAAFPSDVMNERYTLQAEMEYYAGVSQLMVTGSTQNDITSGKAIEQLREIDNTRMALTGDHVRNSVKQLAKLWLAICRRYVKVPRVISISGLNSIGECINWSGDDITSYDVRFDTVNELELSEDLQRQRLAECWAMGVFTESDGTIPQRIKHEMLEKMHIGNYSDIMSINELQIQAAKRENTFFAHGSVLEVSELDDHDIHIDEHTRYALQMKYQILKKRHPEYAALFEAHLKRHKEILAGEEAQRLAPQAGAVR